jgi:hypothetical protein
MIHRRELAPRLRDRGRGPAHPARDRRNEEERQQDDDDPLPEAEIEESLLIAVRLDHGGDRHDRESRPGAETGRREARRQSAPVGKPLERIAYAGAVHRARSDAADRGGDVKNAQRVGIGVERPRKSAQDPAHEHDQPRPVSIDEIAFDRHQPGLEQHENRERHLDRRATPVMLAVDGIDEQRPTVLKVGHHRHAKNAEDEL